MLLYDMEGRCCGYTDQEEAPEGYWLRADDARTRMAPIEFLDALGPQRFAAFWSAAQLQPELAFTMMRGFAAQNILIEESFPLLQQMEQTGLLPIGTAVELWA